MNRDQPGDQGSTDHSRTQLGDRTSGGRAPGGDPNDTLQQYERELRDSGHALGDEGEPGVQGTGSGSREVDR